eukprot:CAMPEP_0115636698 /NCGR_PEP_ID=MMETSP0272-20121206/33806_1 /TAXON_ID=71861 /ORGANISM="Scrippsiella trochoidea, Strain CCMP3099" /LENGTH=30 /DNA_ID= /DNA_START= /DNA_END= /DNA_ORIENTATION=
MLRDAPAWRSRWMLLGPTEAFEREDGVADD